MTTTTAGHAIAGLLTGLGIHSVDARDTLEHLVLSEVSALGLEATVADIRGGRVLLEADPVNAALLHSQLDTLIGALAMFSGGEITTVLIRVPRPARHGRAQPDDCP